MKRSLLAGCRISIFFIATGILLASPQTALPQEALPAGAKVVRLETVPNSITLRNPFEYRQLLVNAYLDNGDMIDATRMVEVDKSECPATISPRGIVRPLTNGQGNLKLT